MYLKNEDRWWPIYHLWQLKSKWNLTFVDLGLVLNLEFWCSRFVNSRFHRFLLTLFVRKQSSLFRSIKFTTSIESVFESFLKYQLQYQLWEFTEFLPQAIFKFYCWNKSFRKSQENPVSAFSQIHFVDYNKSQTFPIYLHLHEVTQYSQYILSV